MVQSGHRAIELTFTVNKGREQKIEKETRYDFKAMDKEAFKLQINKLTASNTNPKLNT